MSFPIPPPTEEKAGDTSCDFTPFFVLTGIVVLIYVILSFCSFGAGIMDAERSGCRSKMKRYEYVFPGYRVGCYMGLAPGEHTESDQ